MGVCGELASFMQVSWRGNRVMIYFMPVLCVLGARRSHQMEMFRTWLATGKSVCLAISSLSLPSKGKHWRKHGSTSGITVHSKVDLFWFLWWILIPWNIFKGWLGILYVNFSSRSFNTWSRHDMTHCVRFGHQQESFFVGGSIIKLLPTFKGAIRRRRNHMAVSSCLLLYGEMVRLGLQVISAKY